MTQRAIAEDVGIGKSTVDKSFKILRKPDQVLPDVIVWQWASSLSKIERLLARKSLRHPEATARQIQAAVGDPVSTVSVNTIKRAANYQQTLTNYLLPAIGHWYGDGHCVFQQDNASCHKAQSIKLFMDEYNFDVMDWPPYLQISVLSKICGRFANNGFMHQRSIQRRNWQRNCELFGIQRKSRTLVLLSLKRCLVEFKSLFVPEMVPLNTDSFFITFLH